MIDVKKLITGFFVVTVLAGTLALALPSFSSPLVTPVSLSADAQDNQLASVAPLGGTNAFAPQVDDMSDLIDPTVPQVDANALTSDPNNLTDHFAASLVTNINNANQDGGSTDAEGNPTIAAPDTNAVIADLADDPVLQNFVPPDWDLEAARQPVHVMANASLDANAQYSAALSAMFQKDFGDTGLQDMVDQSSSLATIDPVASGITGALSDALQIPVPSQLVAFHKSLVKLLVYEKNVVALAQNPGNDPVKSAITFQLEQSKYDSAIADLSRQMQEAQQLNAFSLGKPIIPKDKGPMAFLRVMLGIPTAHAIFGAGDVVFDPVTETETTLTVAELVWKYAQEILLQVLKNSLVIAVQNNILKFTQNGNSPRWVRQLGGLLLTAFNTQGIKELNKEIPALYPTYQGISKLTLQGFYQPFTPTQVLTTIEYTLGNKMGAYVGNFTKGGQNSWAAYGAASLPSGNYYGTLFNASRAAGNAAIRQQTATGNEALASHNFWPIQKCTDNSDPDPKNGNVCDNGKPAVTLTPGQTISSLVDVATGSDVHLIVNAQSLVALAATILTTLLSKLTNGFTLSNSGPGGSPPPPPPPSQPLACVPTSETLPFAFATSSGQVTATFGATGGTATSGMQPNYAWTATGNGGVTVTPASGTGFTFSPVYTVPAVGTYNLTVQLSAGTANTNCALQLIAQ